MNSDRPFLCHVIHEGTDGSDIQPFEKMCMFRYMSPDVDHVYIEDIDRVMSVVRIAVTGVKDASKRVADFMVFVEDGDHLDAVMEAEVLALDESDTPAED